MTVDRYLGEAAVSDGCAAIWCQSVVQLYGVSRLCNYMVSVGYAGIWCQFVMQVYGDSWLCRYMVSVGYAGIWCQLGTASVV